jgi:hypothetical protein
MLLMTRRRVLNFFSGVLFVSKQVRVDPNAGIQVLEKAVTVVTGSTFVSSF